MIPIQNGLPVNPQAPSAEKVRIETQESFAKIFMGVVLSALREAQPAEGLLDGKDSATFRTMLDTALLQQKNNWQPLGVHLAGQFHKEKPDS